MKKPKTRMGRPPSANPSKVIISFRVTADEEKEIVKAAKLAGRKRTVWIRETVLRVSGMVVTEALTPRP